MSREHPSTTWRRTTKQGPAYGIPDVFQQQAARQEPAQIIIEELNARLEHPFYPEAKPGNNGGNGKDSDQETVIIWQSPLRVTSGD